MTPMQHDRSSALVSGRVHGAHGEGRNQRQIAGGAAQKQPALWTEAVFTATAQPSGRMFWFIRKKFFGSYFVFSS